MSKLITINFKLSVLITVFGCIVLFICQGSGFSESLEYSGAYRVQTLIWIASVPALSVLFWFGYYRNEEGHVLAFFLGFIMLIPVLGSTISEAINGAFYSDYEQYYLTYIGLSQVTYGLLRWQEVFEAMGQDANWLLTSSTNVLTVFKGIPRGFRGQFTKFLGIVSKEPELSKLSPELSAKLSPELSACLPHCRRRG